MSELKIETNLETILLNEQTKYRLIEINRIRNNFEPQIREQREIIIRLSKYVTGLDCADRILTGLLTIFSGENIFSHIKDKIGIIKKLLYETQKRKKKHDKILYLGKNKADSVEMLSNY